MCGYIRHLCSYIRALLQKCGPLLQMCRALLQMHVGGGTMICVWTYRALLQLYKGSFAEVWVSFVDTCVWKHSDVCVDMQGTCADMYELFCRSVELFCRYVGALLRVCRALLQIHVCESVWTYRAVLRICAGSCAEVLDSFADACVSTHDVVRYPVCHTGYIYPDIQGYIVR